MEGLTVAEYQAKTIGVAYRHKGVWYSEIYLFLRCCAEAGVTRILESGVKHGMSTALLSAAFEGPVTSVDRAFDISPPSPRHQFIAGDACMLLSTLAAAKPTPVGVLIDGPKDEAAIALKDQLMAIPAVRVVAIHDVDTAPIHSHDESFRSTAVSLDWRVPEPYHSKYHGRGPGLGVWVR